MCSAALSGSQDKQGSQVSLSSRTSISRRRSRKRRPGHRVTVLTTPTKRTTPLSPPAETNAVNECNQSREDTPPAVTSFIPDPIPSAKTPPSHYSVTRGQSTTEVHHRTCVNRFGNELTVHKTRPPLVTVAMPDIQCCSHTTHVLTQWKIHRRAKRKLTSFAVNPPLSHTHTLARTHTHTHTHTHDEQNSAFEQSIANTSTNNKTYSCWFRIARLSEQCQDYLLS